MSLIQVFWAQTECGPRGKEALGQYWGTNGSQKQKGQAIPLLCWKGGRAPTAAVGGGAFGENHEGPHALAAIQGKVGALRLGREDAVEDVRKELVHLAHVVRQPQHLGCRRRKRQDALLQERLLPSHIPRRSPSPPSTLTSHSLTSASLTSLLPSLPMKLQVPRLLQGTPRSLGPQQGATAHQPSPPVTARCFASPQANSESLDPRKDQLSTRSPSLPSSKPPAFHGQTSAESTQEPLRAVLSSTARSL